MNSLLGIPRRPDVIFRSNGNFDLTARVVRSLRILPGDVVDILTDGTEYYLYVARHADAIPPGCRYHAHVYPSKPRPRAHHFRGYSARLCRAILAACGEPSVARLPCGQPITDPSGRLLLPIIIRLKLNTTNP